MSMNRKIRRQSGFTLIEAMVAMTLGLLVLAGITGIFISSSRGYREDAKAAHIHEDLSIAVAQISEDVEMAGFWSSLLAPTRLQVDRNQTAGTGTLAADPGCWPTVGGGVPTAGSSYAGTDQTPVPNIHTAPVALLSNVTGATAHAAFPCIAAADVQTGTDIIAIRRVMGAPTGTYTDGTGLPANCAATTTANTPVCGRVYLRENGAVASLFKPASGAAAPTLVTNPAPAPNVDVRDWEYRIAIYFIRNFAVTAGDGVPTLCRYVLQAGPAMGLECLAQGIENLQLEVGVDTNNDGVVDYYTSGITTPTLNQVRTLRATLLARSVDLTTSSGAAETLLGTTGSYTSAKTYTLAGGGADGASVVVPSTDHFFRKLSISMMQLRNHTSLCVVFACPIQG